MRKKYIAMIVTLVVIGAAITIGVTKKAGATSTWAGVCVSCHATTGDGPVTRPPRASTLPEPRRRGLQVRATPQVILAQVPWAYHLQQQLPHEIRTAAGAAGGNNLATGTSTTARQLHDDHATAGRHARRATHHHGRADDRPPRPRRRRPPRPRRRPPPRPRRRRPPRPRRRRPPRPRRRRPPRPRRRRPPRPRRRRPPRPRRRRPPRPRRRRPPRPRRRRPPLRGRPPPPRRPSRTTTKPTRSRRLTTIMKPMRSMHTNGKTDASWIGGTGTWTATRATGASSVASLLGSGWTGSLTDHDTE